MQRPVITHVPSLCLCVACACKTGMVFMHVARVSSAAQVADQSEGLGMSMEHGEL